MAENRSPGNALAICAVIFSATLCGIAGVILALIGLKKYPVGSDNRLLCIIALSAGSAVLLLEIIWFTIFFVQPSPNYRVFIEKRFNFYNAPFNSYTSFPEHAITGKELQRGEVWPTNNN
ncbi:MAG: hypothetical protein RRY34_06400 [Victivallaceae bacterium]